MGNHISGPPTPEDLDEEEMSFEICENVRAIKKRIRHKKSFTLSPQLIELDMEDFDFYEHCRSISIFCDALFASRTLQILSLRNNHLGLEGLKMISKAFAALKENLPLKILNLYGNEIGNGKGLKYVLRILAKTAVTKLDLGSNNIGDLGLITLTRNPTIRNLSGFRLSRNQLTKKCGPALHEYLFNNSRLTQLILYKNNLGVMGAMAIAEALAVNTSLTSLDVGYNNIMDEGVRLICNSGMRRDNLQSLLFRGNQMTDAGMVHIKSLLTQSTSLQILNLYRNNITSAGAVVLGEGLVSSRSLTFLDLNGSAIGNEGARVIAESLLQMPLFSLSLDVSDSKLGGEGVTRVFETCSLNQNLTYLNFSQNVLAPEEAASCLDYLKAMPALRFLVMKKNGLSLRAAEKISDLLSMNSSLIELNLAGNRFHEEEARIISEGLVRNHHIQTLNIAKNKIGPTGCTYVCRALQHNSSLRSLNMSNNEIGATVVDALTELVNSNFSLVEFDLGRNLIKDGPFFKFRDAKLMKNKGFFRWKTECCFYLFILKSFLARIFCEFHFPLEIIVFILTFTSAEDNEVIFCGKSVSSLRDFDVSISC